MCVTATQKLAVITVSISLNHAMLSMRVAPVTDETAKLPNVLFAAMCENVECGFLAGVYLTEGQASKAAEFYMRKCGAYHEGFCESLARPVNLVGDGWVSMEMQWKLEKEKEDD